jgi:phage terminase large subunit
MSGETGQDKITRWRQHPAQMVRDLFNVEPDLWQEDVLEAFPHKQRIAMKACKGPGKTTVLSWLAWNFLLTRPHAQVAATSITGDNLADGLWKEMSVWQQRSPLLQAAFEWAKQRISSRERPQTWFMSARSWSKSASATEQANALAGLHSDYIMFILDESGGIPDSVMVAAEAALSSPIEGHILQAGNPTHLEGPLYRASTSSRHLWHVVEITGDPDDPKRSPRVSIEWARQQIQEYGRNNPWVMVNVFGEFPAQSMNTLLGPDDIKNACARSYREDDIRKAARVLGVDVARFGDDASVIWPRQGLVALAPMISRNLTSTAGAGWVSRKWGDWDADVAFIDDTGGYGAGWIDNLQLLNRSPIGVGFATTPNDTRYANKRAEIYFEAAEWIKGGGQLPPMTTPGMPELNAAMTRTTYSFKGDKLLLEPKDIVKEKIGFSPDEADAFALTFSQPVMRRARENGRSIHAAEYDPFAGIHAAMKSYGRAHQSDYNPLK